MVDVNAQIDAVERGLETKDVGGVTVEGRRANVGIVIVVFAALLLAAVTGVLVVRTTIAVLRRSVHQHDGVPGLDRARRDDPEVGPRPANGREAPQPTALPQLAPERGARDPW